jgi:RNA polymerase sigma factor (sigma-70 family)
MQHPTCNSVISQDITLAARRDQIIGLRLTQFLSKWEPDLQRLAGRYSRPWCGRDELIQVGLIALVDVFARYSPEKGTMEHYARRSISRAMQRESRSAQPQRIVAAPRSIVRKGGHHGQQLAPTLSGARNPASKSHPAPEPEVLPWGNDDCGPHQLLVKREEVARVRSWALSLPPRQRAIYQALYVEGMPQVKAARLLGVSQARISQLNAVLLASARRDLVQLAA